ncbi:hypothetical protein QNO08_08065 [Arthrobacter sp. zg-Y820]|uniref:hypothetical protein n=1 Tax=unclassified Arthrobacter TaxID=235627 RepID=UPI001E2A6192|nr:MULTISPECIES: hypothetical protein [unclassified Arthrobacter]MCC9196926.1 hypothetical protein [Arthrobacter sp. zg-Y820]MDK1279790.1 hypothetical protein [Arthrobacter sp. zg.Y820]WIB10958.1 hypothetical protein QNO08_08065 [Arthrobacter sp. zg-Y820]
MADKERAGGVDDFWCEPVELVEFLDAFYLGDESVDQAEGATGYADDCGDCGCVEDARWNGAEIEIDDIVEDDDDAEQFPSARPGELDIDQWLVSRVAGTARLTGRYVDITAAETVAALHPLFKGKALAYNLKDFDAAALKNAENRLLTQESQFLWTRKNPDGSDFCDGIQFRSRQESPSRDRAARSSGVLELRSSSSMPVMCALICPSVSRS